MSLSISVPQHALLEAIAQLDAETLSRLADDVLRLKAKKQRVTVTADEADLLQKIGRSGLNETEQSELHTLLAMLEVGDVTTEQHIRLRTLTDKSERLNVERIRYVVELSILWGRPFEDVMTQLGLINPDVA